MFRRIAILASATAGIVAIAVLLVLFGSVSHPRLRKSRTRSPKRNPNIQNEDDPRQPAESFGSPFSPTALSRVDMSDGYTIMDTKAGKAICVSRVRKGQGHAGDLRAVGNEFPTR